MKNYFKIAKILVANLNGEQKGIYDELCNRLKIDKQKPNAILAYWALNFFDGVSRQCGFLAVDNFSNSDLRCMYYNSCPLDKDDVPWLNAWREMLEKTRGENNRANMIDIGVYGLRREDYRRHLNFMGYGAGMCSYMELVAPPYADYAELLGLEVADVVSAFRRLRDCKLFELQRWRSVQYIHDEYKSVWLYVFVPKIVIE